MKSLTVLISLLCLPVILQGQAGKDGSLTISSSDHVVNLYYPLSSDILSGSSVVALAIPATSLCMGDLVMIYQAQGASISTINSASYGNVINYNNAGLYEFKYLQDVSGNSFTVQGSFSYSYSASSHVQVIKVPQYKQLNIQSGGGLAAKKWNDTVIGGQARRLGGIVVIHSSSLINNGVITASEKGFRGGQLNIPTGYITGATNYASGNNIEGGEKGESIAGHYQEYDAVGGRFCRGAPANGGGGGTSTNASGGGGANGNNNNSWNGQGVMIVDAANPQGAWALDPGYLSNGNALTNSSGGGRGGYSWGNANLNALTDAPGLSGWQGDSRREVGGLGGRPLTNINAENRIYFGGGGGSGDANNDGGVPGADGGGIVFIITSTLTGNGQITSDGGSAGTTGFCNCDGMGGGGAGGSIVIRNINSFGNQIITAKGGAGGSQNIVTPPGTIFESEGTGGGGGGGYIAISLSSVNPSIAGGVNGTTQSPSLTEFPSNGGTQGAAGHTAAVTSTFVSYIPGSVPVSATPSIVCKGKSSVLNATGNYTFNWQPGNLSGSSITVTPSVPTIYTVSANSESGCGSYQNTIAVTLASVSLKSTKTLFCLGESRTVTLTANGASNYTWLPSGASTSFIVVSVKSSTSYTVLGSLYPSCTDTAKIALTFTACTQIDNVEIEYNVKIFPNPGKNLYTINGLQAPSIISVFDPLGKLIAEHQSNDTEKTIELPQVTGLFIVRIVSPGFQKKFSVYNQ